MDAPTLEREEALWAEGVRWVAGIDEVGRGPLAGPVVAAVVVLPRRGAPIEGLRDSKRMTVRQRREVATRITEAAEGWALGAASVAEIDRRNILRATALAMSRALSHLGLSVERVLVDGAPIPELGIPHCAIVKGDAVCQSIAAAAVLAKVARDRVMDALSLRYPAYQWGRNKGYGTAAHLAAIEAHGLTRHHRRSFSGFDQGELFE